MPSSRRSVERDRRLPVAPLLLVLVVLIVVSAVISLAIGSEPLPLRGVLDTVGARVTVNRDPIRQSTSSSGTCVPRGLCWRSSLAPVLPWLEVACRPWCGTRWLTPTC